MYELEDLLEDIEKLRNNLYLLIEKNGANLQDPEILSCSEILNVAITKYNELLNKKL